MVIAVGNVTRMSMSWIVTVWQRFREPMLGRPLCTLSLEKGQDFLSLQGHGAALHLHATLLCPYCLGQWLQDTLKKVNFGSR